MSLEFSHKLQDNDIVVVGSDGLFDNLDQKQIGDCVNQFTDKENGQLSDATKKAKAIADTAFKYSIDS